MGESIQGLGGSQWQVLFWLVNDKSMDRQVLFDQTAFGQLTWSHLFRSDSGLIKRKSIPNFCNNAPFSGNQENSYDAGIKKIKQRCSAMVSFPWFLSSIQEPALNNRDWLWVAMLNLPTGHPGLVGSWTQYNYSTDINIWQAQKSLEIFYWYYNSRIFIREQLFSCPNSPLTVHFCFNGSVSNYSKTLSLIYLHFFSFSSSFWKVQLPSFVLTQLLLKGFLQHTTTVTIRVKLGVIFKQIKFKFFFHSYPKSKNSSHISSPDVGGKFIAMKLPAKFFNWKSSHFKTTLEGFLYLTI